MHNRQVETPNDADIQAKTQLKAFSLPQEIATLNSEFLQLDKQLEKLHAEEIQLKSKIIAHTPSETLQTAAYDYDKLQQLKIELKTRIATFLGSETARNHSRIMLEDLKTIRKNAEELYDDIISYRVAGVTFEQAIIKLLHKKREAGAKSAACIRQAKIYYQGVLIQFLRLKINADKHETTQLFNTLTNASLEDFNDQITRLLAVDKITKESAAHAKNLRAIIESEKLNFAKFESNIAEFRYSISLGILGAFTHKEHNLLYCLMPDLQASDKFSLVTKKEIKEQCTANFAQYSVERDAINGLSENEEIDTIRHSVQGFFTAELSVARSMLDSQPEGKYGLNRAQWVFLLSFIEKLTKERHWSDSSQVELDAIINQSHDVLSLLLAIKKFYFNKLYPSSLQLYFLHNFNALPVNKGLLKLANYPAELTTHQGSLEELAKARARLAVLEREHSEILNKLEDRLDKPMIDVLRVNVLHAAMLYFNGGFQNVGVLSCALQLKRINAMQGKHWVLTLLQHLYDPELKRFSDAGTIMKNFLARHAREYSGLSIDSFDIFLMQTLYNDGDPKGLFRMSGADIKKFKIEVFSVPQLTTLFPDNSFRKLVQGLAVKTQDKKALLFAADKSRLSSKIAELNITAEKKSLLQEKLLAERETDKACLSHIKTIFDSSRITNLVLDGQVVNWLKGDLLSSYQRKDIRYNIRDNFLMLGSVLGGKLQECLEAKEEVPARGFNSFSIIN